MALRDESALLLESTAKLLEGRSPNGAGLQEQAEGLLSALGYRALVGDERREAARLLRVGGCLKRVFRLAAPEAPGLCVFGGEADPALIGLQGPSLAVASLAGTGVQLAEALEGCLGEGAEYLAQIERRGDVAATGTARAVDHGLDAATLAALFDRLDPPLGDTGSIDWVVASRLSDAAPCLVPADLALRFQDSQHRPRPLVPPGLACSAGRTVASATLAAVLELVERDAAALWWQAGKPGRPLTAEVLERGRIDELQQALRQGHSRRTTWFLDISTELEVPVVVALSLEPDGKGFAFGLSAQLDAATAARKAFMELCQTELAYHIVDLKRRERGETALNAVDRRHQRRREWAGAAQSSRLQANGTPYDWQPDTTESPAVRLKRLSDALTRQGQAIYYVDLTRSDLEVPAVWACAPQLQPLPSSLETKRLIEKRSSGTTKEQKLALELL